MTTISVDLSNYEDDIKEYYCNGNCLKNLIKIAKETRQRMFGLEAPDIVSVNDAINFIRVAGSHNTGIEFPLTYRKQIGNTVFRITVFK